MVSSPLSPDDGSVIECTPSAHDRSLYVSTRLHESASSPLSSMNVTPTYSLRRASVGDEQQLGAETQRKSLKPVDHGDEDDDVEMIFNDQNRLDYKVDHLQCVICLRPSRNERFVEGKCCCENCASIYSLLNE